MFVSFFLDRVHLGGFLNTGVYLYNLSIAKFPLLAFILYGNPFLVPLTGVKACVLHA